MEILKVEILNPRAKKLLQDLAALKLIRFKDQVDLKTAFKELLVRLRTQKVSSSNLKQITREVEAVRQKRYGI
jgi:transcription initiation factor IIE alpha subunit